MDEKYTWLIKLILAHLLTDFLLQPKQWIDSRNAKHFAAPHLYLHALVTAAMAWLLTGAKHWDVALFIFVTHAVIDGWKSYQKQNALVFLADQALHFIMLMIAWCYVFFTPQSIVETLYQLGENNQFWIVVTSLVLLSTPTGILIGQLTKKWRNRIPDAESLANAGKWIGIIERIIIFLLVIKGEFGAVGLLIAAKSLLRFSEKGRPLYEKSNPMEAKTEYLLIGSLLSLGIALLIGLIAHSLLYGTSF